MTDAQALIRETVDRLRQVQEESEMHQRRRDELESRISALEAEYEALLGSYSCCVTAHVSADPRLPGTCREDDP